MITFDAPTVMDMAMQAGDSVRDCAYKDYTYFAIQLPAGYVYANKFWHPKSYAFLKRSSSTGIMRQEDIPADVMQSLRYEGCYVTDGSMVTLCGQSGELYAVPWRYFKEKYTTVHESRGMGNNVKGYRDHFHEPPVNWTAVSSDLCYFRTKERGLVAFYLPPNVSGAFTRRTGETVIVNSPDLGTSNHGSMIIIPFVSNVSNDANSRLALARALDPSSMDIVPLEVFVDRFNLRIGDWSSIDSIKKLGTKKPLLITEVRDHFKLSSMMHTYTIVGEVNWVTADLGNTKKAIVKDKARQFFVKFAVRLPREREPELLDLLRNFRKLTVGLTTHDEVVKFVRDRLKVPVTLLHSEDLKSLRRVYVTCSERVWMCAGSAVYDRFMELDVNQYVNYGAIFKKDMFNAWKATCLTGDTRLV